MAQLRETAALLCVIAALSAVAEVLLTGRKGETTVCFLLAMAGVGTLLSRIAELTR